MSKASTYQQLRKAAERAQGYAADVAGAALEAISVLDGAKLDKPGSVLFSIPATGWIQEDIEESEDDLELQYPYYIDISVTGITAKDRAAITIAPSSLGTASSCGLCCTNETLAGKIRIRSMAVPEQAIEAEYWIETGKE